MKWLYRIGLVIAGCYVESAIRNTSGTILYWAGKSDVLQGFLPYTVPVVLGYLFLLDLDKYWSDNRLKNDIMGYTVAVLLVGYPLLFTCSLWSDSEIIDPTTLRIRTAVTGLLALGVLVIVLTGRSAAKKQVPLSLPWGTVTSGQARAQEEEPKKPGQAVDAERGTPGSP